MTAQLLLSSIAKRILKRLRSSRPDSNEKRKLRSTSKSRKKHLNSNERKNPKLTQSNLSKTICKVRYNPSKRGYNKSQRLPLILVEKTIKMMN